MSGAVRSKLLFLSVNVIALFVLLQMGLYIAHQFWGLNLMWGFFQFCLTTLRSSSMEHKVIEWMFYGMVGYTVVHMVVQLFKQAYLTWKIERRIQAQQHVGATKRLNRQFRSLGTKIVVVREDAFLALAMGIFRPKILVSTHVLDHFTEQELRAILLHEWHHCKNRDPLKLFLMTLFTDSMKYIPALHGLAHHYKVWRELLADRFVMNTMGSPYELGSVLFKLAGQAKRQPNVGVHFADVAINYRIQQIIEPSEPIHIPLLRGRQVALSVAAALFMMSILLGGCA